MSQPSIQECEAEGYEFAYTQCEAYFGREPTEDEVQDMYEALVDKFSGEF